MVSLTLRHIFARLTSLAQRLVRLSLFYRLLATISLRISWGHVSVVKSSLKETSVCYEVSEEV